MTSKGQVTIPKKVRDFLGLKTGSDVEFEYVGDGRVALKPALSLDERVRRQEQRIERALADLGCRPDFGMTTDEWMRMTRGWGEADYETSLRPLPASAKRGPGGGRKGAKTKVGADDA
jgi:AbrB family looped-hinge helix DNA binding protein